MTTTEGTIFTVVREAADAAVAVAAETDDIRAVLDRVVRDSHTAVEHTPDQLQVLRDADVVDAGGYGLAVIFEGFSRAVSLTNAPAPPPLQPRRAGEPPLRLPFGEGSSQSAAPARRGAAAVAAREEGWGYCTEFLI